MGETRNRAASPQSAGGWVCEGWRLTVDVVAVDDALSACVCASMYACELVVRVCAGLFR